MPRRWPIAILTTCALLALVVGTAGRADAQFPLPGASPTPRPGQPAAPPGGDPRIGQIRAALEKEGLKVLEVGFDLAEGNDPAIWWADTQAQYGRPDWDAVGKQAFTIWPAMYSVVKQDPPATWMMGGQVWTKYVITFVATIGAWSTLIRDFNAATTQESKDRAFKAFVATVKFGVYDLEKRQWVDTKDFTNKNFGAG